MDQKKVTCTYFGHIEVFDIGFARKAQEEIGKVISENDRIEFLFYSTGQSYDSFLTEAVFAKSRFPDKEIVLVRILEPENKNGESDPRGIYFEKRYDVDCPLSLFDEIRYAAAYSGKAKEDTPGYMMIRHHQVVNWVLEQSDIVFTYAYPQMHSTESTTVKNLNKKGKETVSLTSPETAKRILGHIGELEERPKTILLKLSEGATLTEVGKLVGVSSSRIEQNAHKASRDIRAILKREYYRLARENGMTTPASAGIFGLGERNHPYIYDLLILVDFLRRSCGINNLYIDRTLAFSDLVGPIIARQKGYGQALDLIAVAYADESEGENEPEQFTPPYKSVVYVDASGSTCCTADLCVRKYIIESCDYLIADLSQCDDRDEIIRECVKHNTVLINFTDIIQ